MQPASGVHTSFNAIGLAEAKDGPQHGTHAVHGAEHKPQASLRTRPRRRRGVAGRHGGSRALPCLSSFCFSPHVRAKGGAFVARCEPTLRTWRTLTMCANFWVALSEQYSKYCKHLWECRKEVLGIETVR